jgi:hypothetical protein
MSRAESHTTTDHDEIRRWCEERGGKPSEVTRTAGKRGQTGIIRIDFPGYSGESSLNEISWDEFFEKFDQSKLAFLYQDTTADGQKSNFNKFVKRTGSAKARAGGGKTRSAASRSRTKASSTRSASKGGGASRRGGGTSSAATPSKAKSGNRAAGKSGARSRAKSSVKSASGTTRAAAKSAKKPSRVGSASTKAQSPSRTASGKRKSTSRSGAKPAARRKAPAASRRSGGG